jgi:hypothetical protein
MLRRILEGANVQYYCNDGSHGTDITVNSLNCLLDPSFTSMTINSVAKLELPKLLLTGAVLMADRIGSGAM